MRRYLAATLIASAIFAFGSRADAQQPVTTLPNPAQLQRLADGITATGASGTLLIPVTKVTFTVLLTGPDPLDLFGSQTTLGVWNPIYSAGARENSITVKGPPNTTYTGDVPPTSLINVVSTVDKILAAPKREGEAIQVTVIYTVDNCGASIQRARALALADARTNAENIAGSLGVKLGAVLGAEADANFSHTANDECIQTSEYYPDKAPSDGGRTDLSLRISATAAVRYAIK